MFEKWDRELRQKIQNDEKTKGDILQRAEYETFACPKHNMLVEQADANRVYDLELERADLEDYLKTERKYGRTDKTR